MARDQFYGDRPGRSHSSEIPRRGDSKVAGVVIDAWKLSVFRRHLEEAKREYTEHPGITPDTLTLKVKYDWVHELQPIIQAANDECAKIKTDSAGSASAPLSDR